MYLEDEDLGRTASSLGLSTYLVTTAKVRHTDGASSPGDGSLPLARQLLGTRLLFEKWEAPWKARVFETLAIAILALRLCVTLLAPWRLAEERRQFLRAWHVLVKEDWLCGEVQS